MFIDIAARQFYEHGSFIKGYTPATVKKFRNCIQGYQKQSGHTQLSEVSEASVRALFLHGRMEKQWASSTYLVFHKCLSVFFRWCIKQGYMHINPLEAIEKPKLEQRIPTKLTKQDAFKLLECIDNYPYPHPFLRYRDYAVFSVFLFAGLRKQELLNLKYSEVDVDNLTITVRKGKGNKDRLIPMTYTLAETLKRYLLERKKLNKTCPYFFTSQVHNCGFTDITLKRLVGELRLCSGLSFTVHKLRHTFATLMLEGGCDLYSLQKMMGHSDIKTTTIYLSATAEHLRTQIGKHPLNF